MPHNAWLREMVLLNELAGDLVDASGPNADGDAPIAVGDGGIFRFDGFAWSLDQASDSPVVSVAKSPWGVLFAVSEDGFGGSVALLDLVSLMARPGSPTKTQRFRDLDRSGFLATGSMLAPRWACGPWTWRRPAQGRFRICVGTFWLVTPGPLTSRASWSPTHCI